MAESNWYSKVKSLNQFDESFSQPQQSIGQTSHPKSWTVKQSAKPKSRTSDWWAIPKPRTVEQPANPKYSRAVIQSQTVSLLPRMGYVTTSKTFSPSDHIGMIAVQPNSRKKIELSVFCLGFCIQSGCRDQITKKCSRLWHFHIEHWLTFGFSATRRLLKTPAICYRAFFIPSTRI